MSNRMQGMDTEEARNVASNLGKDAAQVAGVVSSISSVIGNLKWQGSDRSTFESDWSGTFAPQASQASEEIDQQAQVLVRHADRQDEVSS